MSLPDFEKVHNVVIIGSGPAGHTAAIYTARALLKPIMFEGEMAGGVAAGGQLTTTTDVENFPGFPNGIMGPELMIGMREQSVNSGTEIYTKTVLDVDFSKSPYEVRLKEGVIKTHTVIIATGATAKRLGAKGESEYWQKGISACAVCDGALPIFRNKPLYVIGGGDTAAEEAMFLSKYASEVTLLVRRNELRASKVMQDRLFSNEKVTIKWNTELEECQGDKYGLTHLLIRNNQSNETEQVEASGLFYAIGHEPNTTFLNGSNINMDDTGYILVKAGTAETNVEGVYACGDVQDKIYRQAITAAGTGCMAGLEVERYLSEKGLTD